MEHNYIIGIDIGGTNVRIGMVKQDATLKNFKMEKSVNLLKHHPIDNLSHFIQEYMIKNVTNEEKILGVAIGFPSTIDKDKKVVLSTPNIQGLNQLNVVSKLQEDLGFYVYIDRDVNFLLQYDMYYHNFKKEGIILGFYIGTGFGNAIHINGSALVGHNGTAGELGHIPIFKDEKPCQCGNNGCIENYASGKRLQEIKDIYFPESNLSKIFTKHREHSIIQEYIEYLSIPIATEINIFDPDYILLGGGVLQMDNFPFTCLEANIYRHVRKPYPANNLKYYYSRNNQKNGVIGAGLYGFNRIKEETK